MKIFRSNLIISLQRLSFYLLGILFGSILVFCFSYFVDPYGIFNSASITGFNKLKPEFSSYSRISKPWIISRIKPRSIILGASSSETGFNPDHKAWSKHPTYNFAFGSGRNYETFRYLQHAVTVAPVEDVLLGLDFVMFSGRPEPYVGNFSEQRLALTYNGTATRKDVKENLTDVFFSINHAKSAFKTIFFQNEYFYDKNNHYPPHIYNSNGQRKHLSNLRYIGALGDVESIWKKALITRYTQLEKLNPNVDPFIPMSNGIDRWELLRKLITFSHDNNLNLHLVLPPCHATYLDLIDRSGMWGWFEIFKQTIVDINTAVSKEYNRTAFPIVDYCIYNKYTSENIFGREDKLKPLKWFWDPNHFRSELGDVVINEVISRNRLNQDSKIFGASLSVESINEHLADQRKNKYLYKQNNLQDMSVLEELIDKL